MTSTTTMLLSLLLLLLVVFELDAFFFVQAQSSKSVKTFDELKSAIDSVNVGQRMVITVTTSILIIPSSLVISKGSVVIQAPKLNGKSQAEESDDDVVVPNRIQLGGSLSSFSGQTTRIVFQVLTGASLSLENLEIQTMSSLEEGLVVNGGAVDYIRNCNFVGNGGNIVVFNNGAMNEISSSFFVRLSKDIALSTTKASIRVMAGSTISRIASCNFLNSNQGGAIINYGTISSIDKCLFDQDDNMPDEIVHPDILNQATKQAVLTVLKSAISNFGFIGPISSSTFQGLRVKGKGAAINNALTGRVGDIGAAIFARNIASEDGGAIYSLGTILSITSSIFHSNAAGLNGGAILLTGSSAKILSGVASCSFIGNFASMIGGAINIRAGAAINAGILRSLFEKNNAVLFGGGVSLDAGSAFVETFDACQFIGNSASRGGALQIAFLSMINSIKSSTFKENRATSFFGGGAIFIGTASSPNLLISDCVFESNNAVDGGAIRIVTDALVFKIERSRFIANQGEQYGALTVYGTLSYLQSCFFTRNSGSVASAVYVDDATLTSIDDCVFVKNIGLTAIVNKVGIVDYVRKSFFSGNGQAISNQFLIRNIEDSVFIGDTIQSLGSDMDLARSGFSTKPFCSAQLETKTKCPICRNCPSNGFLTPLTFCASVMRLPSDTAKSLCSLIPACLWANNQCIVNENGGSVIVDPTPPVPSKSPTTSAPTVQPTAQPTAAEPRECKSVNSIRNKNSRIMSCNAIPGCTIVNGSKCGDTKQRLRKRKF